MSRDARLVHLKSSRYRALDGLRGIAVLIVLLSHLGNSGLFLLPGLGHNAIGKAGVWIFFGLSGFLLTFRLGNELATTASKGRSLLAYGLNRLFRIYPLYIVVIATHWLTGNFTTDAALAHLTLMDGRDELWAIPVEFKYYLVIPVLAIAPTIVGWRWAMGLMVGAAIAMVSLTFTVSPEIFSNKLGLCARITPFICGSLLALWRMHESAEGRKSTAKHWSYDAFWLALLFGTTAVYRMMALGALPIAYAAMISLILGIAVAVLIDTSLRGGFADRLLSCRPLAFVGQVSFSIYLWHMFVIRFFGGFSINACMKAWIVIAMVLIASALSYWVIEGPGIRLGHKLAGAVNKLGRET